MKKNVLLFTCFVLIGASLITSCTKDDTTPPIITLNGSSDVESVLNAPYSDAGATASDDEDGTLEVFTSGTVNKDLVGSYVITYTATDKAGNMGTATRTVRVFNEAEIFIGNYNVVDSFPGTTVAPYPYTQSIRVDSTINKRIRFNKFGDYANNTNIYATATGSKFEIPVQTATAVGSGSGTCDVVNRQFSSDIATFSTISASIFRFTYTDAITTSGCISSATVNSYWVKQ